MYLIITSSNNFDILEKISKKLIKKSLSKCNQISKIKSIYKWDNKINYEDEFKLEIKSKHIKKVYKLIKKYHNYECFEFVYHKVKSSKEYKNYLKER